MTVLEVDSVGRMARGTRVERRTNLANRQMLSKSACHEMRRRNLRISSCVISSGCWVSRCA
jgi:hypothetical protein